MKLSNIAFASLCVVGLALTGCGFEAPPRAPKGEPKTFPAVYPKPTNCYPADDELF